MTFSSGSVGIEPTTTASETDVIPFHHDPMTYYKIDVTLMEETDVISS